MKPSFQTILTLISPFPFAQVTARINSRYADPSGAFPDLQIFFGGYNANCAKSGEVNAPIDGKNPDLPRELTISPVVLHPKSKGYLTLRSSDPLDRPLIYANYLTDPEDVATLVEGVRVVQRLANTSVLREKYGIELEEENYGPCNLMYRYDSDEFWECAVKYYTGPENHQAGSCKMGPSWDRMAVVNPKLQVLKRKEDCHSKGILPRSLVLATVRSCLPPSFRCTGSAR